MNQHIDPPTDHAVTVMAANGHTLIHQGVFRQSLCLLPDQLPRFLHEPATAAILVIPRFASAALASYTHKSKPRAISIRRDLILGDFTLHIELQSHERIIYYSDPEAIIAPRILLEQGIGIAITPALVASISHSDGKPSVRVIASIPRPEKPDYPGRFASDATHIRDLVVAANQSINPQST